MRLHHLYSLKVMEMRMQEEDPQILHISKRTWVTHFTYKLQYPLLIFIMKLESLGWSFLFQTFEISLKLKQINYLLATDFSYPYI